MSSRTMIGKEYHPDQFQSHTMVVPKVHTEDLAVKAEHLDIVEIDGQQYAKLPEGWPAEENPSLLEAHVEHVMSEGEGLSAYEEELYSFTPAEVKELAEGYIDAMNEVRALRKGMKTMQRKTRKQAQQQRRLERRLNQARAGREQLRDTASKLASHRLSEAATALLEVLDKRGLVVREGE